MRLIDADALDIDNLNRAYDDNFELDFGRLYTADVIDMIANASTINAIPIPEDATNGDVLKKMFPTAKFYCAERLQTAGMPRRNADFDVGWWNAPYKESEDKE